MSEKPREAKDLVLSSGGLPVMSTMGDQLMYAESLLRSKLLPKSYETASQVVVAMQLASELGMKPGVKSLSRTCVINGVPSLFGEAPLSIVQSSGLLDGIEFFYFDKGLKKICFENGNIAAERFGFFCKMKRKGVEGWHEEYYTTDEAKKAGLYNKDRSVWLKHPEDMLKWRVIGKLIKLLFADLMAGTNLAEYDFNTAPVEGEAIQANIEPSKAYSETNERFVIPAAATLEKTVIDAKAVEVVQAKVVKAIQEAKTEESKPVTMQEIDEETGAPVMTNDQIAAQLNGVVDIELPSEDEICELMAYKIKVGDRKGKLLSELTRDQVLASFNGTEKFLSKKTMTQLEMMNKPSVQELNEKLKRYLEVVK